MHVHHLRYNAVCAMVVAANVHSSSSSVGLSCGLDAQRELRKLRLEVAVLSLERCTLGRLQTGGYAA